MLVALLSLGPAPAERPVDTRGALELRRSVYADPELIGVDVQLLMGILYLRGSVPDADARERAQALASRIGGIDEIRNRVRIEPPSAGNRSDGEIERELASALARAGAADPSAAAFSVARGRVSLSGSARDPATAAAWIEAVRSVEGVRSIAFDALSF